jgi:CheY-like chemotaxis protein
MAMADEARRGEPYLRSSIAQPRFRVLWVDDEPRNNEYIAKDLERRGVHVSYALSTSLALTLLARNRYLAVISDMGRKEGPREGFHLLDTMRAAGDTTPLFFFASLNAPTLGQEALLHDAQGSTNDARELLAMVEGLLPAHLGDESR